jgi:hypothetical protein
MEVSASLIVMAKNQKLELTWIGKENRPKLEPRILLEESERSYYAKHRVGERDQFGYQLIFGDNLLSLKALEAEFAGKVKYLFGGFSRCLYQLQKFNSDSERRMAEILEREATKWFKPAKGQFHIYYSDGHDPAGYQPDFVAETPDGVYMLEPKASNEMTEPSVLANGPAPNAKAKRRVWVPHDGEEPRDVRSCSSWCPSSSGRPPLDSRSESK